jgi:hypothetical protein
MPFSEAVSRVVLSPVVLPVIAVIFLLPFFTVGLILHRRKKAYLAVAHEPFTQLPLRLAHNKLIPSRSGMESAAGQVPEGQGELFQY